MTASAHPAPETQHPIPEGQLPAPDTAQEAPSRREPLASSERGQGPILWRFTPLERTLHVLVVISFLGLVITGIPLHFSYAAWARSLVRVLGGFQVAAFFHRVFALVIFGYFLTHIGYVAYRVTRLRSLAEVKEYLFGPHSMVPGRKDIQDVIQQFKWYLGRGERPRFDRFSYMEKFDYWAVFWGVAIIGGSGLLLWAPEFFARFLPGWVFNIATIVHGEEALLALGFIFTIHFFNVHLRPEKFPIDLVIFTGRATAEYMREEHPLEYERLEREGKLKELEAPPASRALYLWSIVFGFAALGLGLSVIALLIWTLIFEH
jgi:cytochrome b subunit of formate dehydrogenase